MSVLSIWLSRDRRWALVIVPLFTLGRPPLSWLVAFLSVCPLSVCLVSSLGIYCLYLSLEDRLCHRHRVGRSFRPCSQVALTWALTDPPCPDSELWCTGQISLKVTDAYGSFLQLSDQYQLSCIPQSLPSKTKKSPIPRSFCFHQFRCAFSILCHVWCAVQCVINKRNIWVAVNKQENQSFCPTLSYPKS